MAVAFDRRLGESNSGTGSNAGTIATGGLSAGEFVVLWVACDNVTATSPSILIVTYGGVTQTGAIRAEHNASSASAGAATRGFIYVIPSVNVTGASGSDLVGTWGGGASPAKSVMIAAVFTGASDTLRGTQSNSTSINVGLNLTGKTAGDLALGLWSWEGNAGSSGSMGAPGGDGQVFTTGGGAASNVSMYAGYSVMGGTSGLWSPPTMSNDGGMCGVALQPGATGIDLVIADASHAHAADAVAVTQVHSAVVADATHGHAADNVNVTKNSNVAVADSTHSHAADNVAVTVVTNLVVADSTHGHTADSIAVAQVHNVTIAEARSTHAADNVAITQAHSAVVADSSHAHAADNLALTGGSTLVVADATHAHSADNVAVTQESSSISLVVADASHAHSAEGLVLTQVHVLVLADTLHGHAVDVVTITTGGNLTVADSTHGHTADSVNLGQVHILVIQETSHGHTVDGLLVLTQETPPVIQLFVADGHHHHGVDSVSLSQVHILTVQEARHLLGSDLANVDEATPVYVLILNFLPEHVRLPITAIDRVGVRAGLTLYRIGGVWYEGRNVRASVLADADLVYRGGYENIVEDPAVRAELTGLGYSFETRYV